MGSNTDSSLSSEIPTPLSTTHTSTHPGRTPKSMRIARAVEIDAQPLGARAEGVNAFVEHEETHARAALHCCDHVLHCQHRLPRAGSTHDERAPPAIESAA